MLPSCFGNRPYQIHAILNSHYVCYFLTPSESQLYRKYARIGTTCRLRRSRWSGVSSDKEKHGRRPLGRTPSECFVATCRFILTNFVRKYISEALRTTLKNFAPTGLASAVLYKPTRISRVFRFIISYFVCYFLTPSESHLCRK